MPAKIDFNLDIFFKFSIIYNEKEKNDIAELVSEKIWETSKQIEAQTKAIWFHKSEQFLKHSVNCTKKLGLLT